MIKLTIDDPRLTAYAFGELNPKEIKEVAKQVASDPLLKAAVDELVAIETIFQVDSEPKYSLRPEQRAAIFQSSAEPSNVVHIPEKNWGRRVVAVLGVAAAVVISLTILQRPSGENNDANIVQLDWSSLSDGELLQRVSPSTESWMNMESASAEQPSKLREGLQMHASSLRSEIAERAEGVESSILVQSGAIEQKSPWVLRSDRPEMRIPLVAGNASYAWVRKSVAAGEMPSPASVRLEELLNHCPARRLADITHNGVSAGVEIIESPLDSSELLLFLSFNAQQSVDLEAALEFSKSVKSYKLLGYQQPVDGLKVASSQLMEVGSSQQVAYVLKLADAVDVDEPVFNLLLREKGTAEQASLGVVYSKTEWGDLSSGGKMQLLVVAWAEWLVEPMHKELRKNVELILAEVEPANESETDLLGIIHASLAL
ncbi:MAG: von Willebrand factor type A domain-containing protein [Rubritalea sp.]|uniref:VWA domain-containing protein n=1 Tax=Rubritalea sp. TaxID=2109375 RepID=UPI0032423E35